jgi:hypothetical protein
VASDVEFGRKPSPKVKQFQVDTMKFFIVKGPELWGDYGAILIRGMTAHLPRKDDRLQLERTGPFIPPITFPGVGDVLVTDEFRNQLAESQLGAFEFRPVVKARIVNYQWEKWNRSAEEPVEYPESGEPENYILSRPHSPRIADAIGNVWEVVVEDGAIVDTDSRRAAWDYDIRVDASTWSGDHLFRGRRPPAKRGGWVIVTETGKEWLEQRAGDWVHFEACLVRE